MSLEAALYAYLSDALSIGDRIYPMGHLPQDVVLPAMTYQVVAGPTSHYSHGGASDSEVSVQLDCWAADTDGAFDLADELRAALDGYSGWWDDVRIGSVFLGVVMDDHEPDVGLYRRMRQADIHYSEPQGS